MSKRPKTWDELEQRIGVQRTVPPAPTQRDVTNLTRKRLAKSPFWKRMR